MTEGAATVPPDLLALDSPMVILAGLVDRGGVVTYASPNLERVLRWKPERVLGVPGWLVQQLGWADAHRLREAVRLRHRAFQAETLFRRGDGTETWVSVTGWLRPDLDEPTGIVYLQEYSDAVEARRAEQRLAVNLEQAERMEGLARLSGGVAHDFNNLLSIILNFTAFASESLETDPEAARADLAEVAQAAARAAELTRKLLVFARRDASEPSVSDVCAVLAEAEPALADLATERAVALAVDAGAAGALPVPMEARLLRQLLQNLFDNALDAMPDGGRLSISAKSLTVPAAAHAPADLPAGRYVRLQVADTGLGAPPTVVARMFEPFFTTRRRGVGSGLGLAVVHGLVGRAAGSIAVRSTEGEGTVVEVWLSLVGAATEEPAGDGARGGAGERLLVVDDEAPVLEAARRILASAGYDVTGHTDPLEALALLQSGTAPFAALITDVVMPALSGPELADAARRAVPGLPVLFVSGYAAGLVGPSDQLPAGIRMLRKPFSDEELLARVAECLARAHGPADAPGDGGRV